MDNNKEKINFSKEDDYEPSTVTIEEAVDIVPFQVKLPTYFPFEVQYSHAQLYISNPTDVVFSFWQVNPDHKEVVLHISKTKLEAKAGQSIQLANQIIGTYTAESTDIGLKQKISWTEKDGLYYMLDYRADEKISKDELLKIQASIKLFNPH